MSDPYHLPRWWPGVAARRGGAPPTAWTTVLDLAARASPCAPTTRRVDGRRAERGSCGARSSSESPFERILRESSTGVALERRGRRRHPRASSRSSSSRAAGRASAPFQLRARRRAASSTGRSTGWTRLRRGRAGCAGGAGARTAHDVAAARARAGAAARRARRWTRARRPRPVALEEVRAARPAPARRGARAAGRRSSGDEHVRDDRARARRARRRAQLPGPGAAARGRRSRRARRRRLARLAPTRCARVLERVRRGAASRSCPFGGGTSVVGGVEPLRGRLRGGRLARPARAWTALVEVDQHVADRARSRPGLFGPEAERRSRAQGLTLGHFPQSFEYSTVGGWVATRSAGQASTGYGRIDELVEGAAAASRRPASSARSARARPRAAGPGAARAGGRLRGRRSGVIMRGHAARAPAARARAATRAGRSARSRRAARRFACWSRRTPRPTSRACPTRTRRALSLALRRRPAARAERARPRLPALRGHEGGCLAIVGFEGDADEVARRRRPRRARCCARRAGCARARGRARRGCAAATRGALPARRAARPRRDGRDARDGDDLEQPARPATRPSATRCDARSRERGTPPLVMCHVSHLYRVGRLALLHVPRAPGARARSSSSGARRRRPPATRSSRTAARSPTTTRSAATTRPGCAPRSASSGIDLLRAAKERLDPAGIMNPGKLLPLDAARLASCAPRPAATRTTAPEARAPAPAAGWPCPLRASTQPGPHVHAPRVASRRRPARTGRASRRVGAHARSGRFCSVATPRPARDLERFAGACWCSTGALRRHAEPSSWTVDSHRTPRRDCARGESQPERPDASDDVDARPARAHLSARSRAGADHVRGQDHRRRPRAYAASLRRRPTCAGRRAPRRRHFGAPHPARVEGVASGWMRIGPPGCVAAGAAWGAAASTVAVSPRFRSGPAVASFSRPRRTDWPVLHLRVVARPVTVTA